MWSNKSAIWYTKSWKLSDERPNVRKVTHMQPSPLYLSVTVGRSPHRLHVDFSTQASNPFLPVLIPPRSPPLSPSHPPCVPCMPCLDSSSSSRPTMRRKLFVVVVVVERKSLYGVSEQRRRRLKPVNKWRLNIDRSWALQTNDWTPCSFIFFILFFILICNKHLRQTRKNDNIGKQ